MPVVMRALRRKPPTPKPPASDPRFKKVSEALKRNASTIKKHPPARKKADEAAAAAKGPPNEKAAGAKEKQVDKMEGAKTKKPESNSFLALLRAEIEKAMPKTLGDTEKFMEGGQSGDLKGSLKGNVSQQKEEATGDVASASTEQPKEAGVPTKESKPVPDEPPPGSPEVRGSEGMPAPKSAEDVSLQDSKQDSEAAMNDAEVTPTQLKKANDPRFSAVLTAKDQVAKQADEAPGQFRTKETATLGMAASQAMAASRKGAGAMLGVKGKSKSAVLTRQQQQKLKDEKERKKVADDIEAIYNRSKERVEAKLATLETEVGAIFDAGTDAALAAMTKFVNARLRRYKIDRYLSIPLVGQARWVRDQFMGLPDEVNAFYVEGRALFTSRMDALVVRVANLVETRLKEAKAEVARGQAEIKQYVAKLPKNLQSVGKEAQTAMEGRFKELEQGIEDKKNQLAQQLAQKYKEANEKADKALKEIQDANKGLVQAFVEKLGEIIRILIDFKDKLMAILRKGAAAIKLIIADPIGFLSNLIAALKQGFNQFKANIESWLIKGIIGWLFGALAEAGVTPPADFSLPSILKLVMQILGITYERMRAKAVKLLGPAAVDIIEKLVGYVRTLMTGGPAALWEEVKGDLANLKDRILGDIKNMIIEAVIKAAVAKIVSMFNPVGAIVQAVLAIINTVMFIVEQAKRIMALVSAVVDSVMDIAQGAIGAAANKVEQALGMAIPILIGFLARLIGIGDIPKRATAVIKKVQDAIDKAIDKALAKIIGVVKKMLGKGGAKGKKKDEKEIKDLKGKVEKDLSGKLSGVKDAAKVKSVVAGVMSKYRPEGLKALNVKALPKKAGQFEIEASINPVTKVNQFEVALGIDTKYIQLIIPKTVLTATLKAGGSSHELGQHESQSPDDSKAVPGKHAERQLLDSLNPKWASLAARVPNKTDVVNELIIKITRSPCTTPGHNCAGLLSSFASEKTNAGMWGKVKLRLQIMTVYWGNKPQGKKNQVALKELADAGHDVEVWDVLEILKQAGVEFGDSDNSKKAKQELERRIKQTRAILEEIKKSSAK